MSDKSTKDPLLDDENPKTGDNKAKPAKAEAPAPAEPVIGSAKPAANVSKAQAEIKDLAEQTKQILAKQPKVNFIIPLADGESPDAEDTVQINSYKLTIKKGVMVELPQAVAQLLAEKYRIQMTAGAEHRIDRKEDVREALS